MSGTEMNETNELIASDKVEGTAVYDQNGTKLGSVHNFMVDKRSGQVAYAVLSFGGFLGMGSSYHPLPWKQLVYEPAQGGYVVNLTRDQLEAAPTYSDTNVWDEPGYGRGIDEYYGTLGGMR